jgi:hypothetical protein
LTCILKSDAVFIFQIHRKSEDYDNPPPIVDATSGCGKDEEVKILGMTLVEQGAGINKKKQK